MKNFDKNEFYGTAAVGICFLLGIIVAGLVLWGVVAWVLPIVAQLIN